MMTLKNASPNEAHWRSVFRPMQCQYCTRPITQTPKGRPRRTCSDLCRQKYRRRRLDRHGAVSIADRKARAADKILRSVERHRGKVDDTPYKRGLLLSMRNDVRFDLREGLPPENCQWCGKLMSFRTRRRSRLRCCSERCRVKFSAFRIKLEDALHYIYKGQVDPMVTHVLRDFDFFSKKPQAVLRYVANVCKHCGKPYPVWNLNRRYCSKRCRQAAWYRRHHTNVADWRRCQGCFKKFRVRTKAQKTCGPSCRQRHELAVYWFYSDVLPRHCAECGELFLTRNPQQKYCEFLCKNRHNVRKLNAKTLKTQPRERCVWCGETLPTDHKKGRHRQLCSGRCKTALWRSRKEPPIPVPVEFQISNIPLSRFAGSGVQAKFQIERQTAESKKASAKR